MAQLNASRFSSLLPSQILRFGSNDHLLQLGKLLSPLLGDFLLAELPCLAPQHLDSLLVCELHLVTHRHQAAGNVVVILPQQVDGKHHVVDVIEYEGILIGVLLLLRQERHRMVAPMTKRVEVVRGVVTIVVAVAVALIEISCDVKCSRNREDLRAHR
jgi:hypothetical protein